MSFPSVIDISDYGILVAFHDCETYQRQMRENRFIWAPSLKRFQSIDVFIAFHLEVKQCIRVQEVVLPTRGDGERKVKRWRQKQVGREKKRKGEKWRGRDLNSHFNTYLSVSFPSTGFILKVAVPPVLCTGYCLSVWHISSTETFKIQNLTEVLQ